MRYLSYLEDDYISLERIQYSKGAKEFSAVVSELEGDSFERRRLDEFVGEDILGCSIGKKRGAIVKLDKRKALLHKHIVGIEKSTLSRKIADLDVIVGHVKTGVVNKSNSFDSAIIRMEHESYESAGCSGSVILKKEDTLHGIYVMSMYDLFVDLCRRTGFNLMLYKSVMICSRWNRTAFIVTLSDTRQAGVYFTKMYLDVMR